MLSETLDTGACTFVPPGGEFPILSRDDEFT